MNEKEIAELRRRFNPEKSSAANIIGCYVNEKKEIVSSFTQSIAALSQDETEKFFSIFKRSLSGTLDKNLLDICFTTAQVAQSDEHQLLMHLKNSALKDNDSLQKLYEAVISAYTTDSNYLILLMYDTYDVPYFAKDGNKSADASDEVFSYFCCAICPVKETKPCLSYIYTENEIHALLPQWVISPPALGFLFPAFDDRSTNIYNALYYSKSIEDNHQEVADAIFNTQLPMPAQEQKETFETVLSSALEEECSLHVVNTVHDHILEIIEEHKANKEEDIQKVSKQQMKSVLKSCGISEEKIQSFGEKYDSSFGDEAELSPKNIINPKQLQIKTPDVTININPQRGDLIETRIIDGLKYILIKANDEVSINGVNIHIDNGDFQLQPQ